MHSRKLVILTHYSEYELENIMPIYWDEEKFSVGNEVLDTQHKGLLQLALQLETTIQEDNEAQQLNLFVIEIHKYFETHFAFEEELMEAGGYEHIDEHMEAHERFSHLMERVLGE
jgi:hemerythrin